MAQPFLDELERLARRFAAGSPEVACRHFFAGAALYVAGQIITLSPVGLAFKLPEQVCRDLIDSGSAMPLRYFENGPIKPGYALFANSDELAPIDVEEYFSQAIAHAWKRRDTEIAHAKHRVRSRGKRGD